MARSLLYKSVCNKLCKPLQQEDAELFTTPARKRRRDDESPPPDVPASVHRKIFAGPPDGASNATHGLLASMADLLKLRRAAVAMQHGEGQKTLGSFFKVSQNKTLFEPAIKSKNVQTPDKKAEQRIAY